MVEKTSKQNPSGKTNPEEVFTDRGTQFKLWLVSGLKIFNPRNRSTQITLGVITILLLGGVIFFFRDQLSSLVPLLNYHPKEASSFAAKKSIFSHQLGTKELQGRVISFNQNKGEIIVMGQVGSANAYVKVEINSSIKTNEITYDPKTAVMISTDATNISGIKNDDLVRVTTSKDILGDIKAVDVNLIEILRPKK